MRNLFLILSLWTAGIFGVRASCPSVTTQVRLETLKVAMQTFPYGHEREREAAEDAAVVWAQVLTDLAQPTTTVDHITPPFSGDWGPEASPMVARELLSKVQSGEIPGVFFSGEGEFKFSLLRRMSPVYLAIWSPEGLQLYVLNRHRRFADGTVWVDYKSMRGTSIYPMSHHTRAWGLAIQLGRMAGLDLSRSFKMPPIDFSTASPNQELIAQRNFLQRINALFGDRSVRWSREAFVAVRSAFSGTALLGFKSGEFDQFYVDRHGALSRIFFIDGEFRIDTAVERPEDIVGAERQLAIFPMTAPTVGNPRPLELAVFKNQLTDLIDHFPRPNPGSRWPQWAAVRNEAAQMNDLVLKLYRLLDTVPEGFSGVVVADALKQLMPPAWARNTLLALAGSDRAAPISQSQLAGRLRLIADFAITDPLPAMRAEALTYWISLLSALVPDARYSIYEPERPGDPPFEVYRDYVLGHLVELAFFLEDTSHFRMGGSIDGMLFRYRQRFHSLMGRQRLQALSDALGAADLLKRDADLIQISAHDALLHGLIEVKSAIHDLGRVDELIAQLQRLARVIEIVKEHGLMHADGALTLAVWRTPTPEAIRLITTRMNAAAPNVPFRVVTRATP